MPIAQTDASRPERIVMDSASSEFSVNAFIELVARAIAQHHIRRSDANKSDSELHQPYRKEDLEQTK